MFELLLSVCVSASLCEYLASPIRYATEESCRIQAALIAGTVAGDNPPSDRVIYRFRCKAAATAADWIEVTVAIPEDLQR